MKCYTIYQTVGYEYDGITAWRQRQAMADKIKLVNKVQNRILQCMKDGNVFERDMLKTVLGEVQTIHSRTGKMDDDGVIKVFKKFKQGVEETIELNNKMDFDPILLHDEIKIYDQYIPATMGVGGIVKLLTDITDKIKDAKSDGQATGIAMGFIKNNGTVVIPVDGKDVSEAVKQIRS